MNKLFIYFVVALIGLSSCNDWLDIRPEGQTVLEDYWRSEAQATQVLASCYKGLTFGSSIERMLAWGEFRSDNVVQGLPTNQTVSQVLYANITATNGYADWGQFYTVINYCNTFLHFAPTVLEKDQNFTPNKLHTLEAEARAIRALSYFYLVRAFRDVPLITEPSITDEQNYNVGKSPERQVLDTIIADLKFAQQYARPDYGKGAYNKGRFTQNSVNALLADVYLWDQQYQQCADACDLIINANKFTLVTGDKVNSEVFYKGNSTESVFELQFDKDTWHNGVAAACFGTAFENNGVLSYPVYLIRGTNYCPFNYQAGTNIESEKDLREFNSYSQNTSSLGTFQIYKYSTTQVVENSAGGYTPTFRSSASTVNWIIYRLSDIMLMKAEALNQLPESNDNKAKIMNLVNTTYLRSNPTADSLSINNYSDKNAIEKLVLRERQRELLFEGKRWFDLMRLVRRKNDPLIMLSYISPKLTANSMSISKLGVMDALYMPILKSQIEINPELEQNPFYLDENISYK